MLVSRAGIKLAIGIAIAVLYTAVVVHAGISPASRDKISEKLADKVTQAALAETYPWAEIELDGQVARISGEAPSENAAQEIFFAALQSVGSGGALFGGVTNVDMRDVIIGERSQLVAARVAQGAVQDPFMFNAILSSDKLTLTGYVHNEAARREVLRSAQAIFTDHTINDGMEIAFGSIPDRSWRDAVFVGLSGLHATNYGELSINNLFVTINGEAQSPARYDAIIERLGELPSGFVSAVGVARPVSNPSAEVEASLGDDQIADLIETADVGSISNSSDGENLAAGRSAQPCRPTLQSLIDGVNVQFNSSSTRLSSSEQRRIEAIGNALISCPSARIRVIGHTDSSGRASRNRRLSLQRAEAITQFLLQHGVAAAQLSSYGAGESEPLVSNGTLDGRARNRRIEIRLEPEQ